ncbi:MAG: hypothetical protein V3U34_00635 [candidate division NC10 bacterium]
MALLLQVSQLDGQHVEAAFEQTVVDAPLLEQFEQLDLQAAHLGVGYFLLQTRFEFHFGRVLAVVGLHDLLLQGRAAAAHQQRYEDRAAQHDEHIAMKASRAMTIQAQGGVF